MSYNVTRIQVITLDATMDARTVVRFCRELEADLPEQNLVSDHKRQAEEALDHEETMDPAVAIPLRSFAWTGEGSGGRWWEEVFKEKVAPAIRGLVEAIIIWERGGHVSGLRIRDGVVTEPRVIMTLEEEATR